MHELEERIVKEGLVLSDDILKVDRFLNHQIDPQLMDRIGKEFFTYFKDRKIDKVVTVESSGIAPALMTGLHLNCPVIFARKHKSLTMKDNLYTAKVHSFTKNVDNQISISKQFIQPGDQLLFIDDFLANGQAANGILELAKDAQADIVGMGMVIEKSFQSGRKELDQKKIDVYSLARISSLKNGQVHFID